MGKVIESKGLQAFIQDGTVTHVPNHKDTPKDPPKPAPEPESAKTGTDAAPAKGEEKAPDKVPDPDEGLDALPEGSRRYVNKQLRLRKEAEEALQDAETFAKGQYERARLAEERAQRLEEQTKTHKVETPALVEPDIASFTKDGQVDWIAYTKATREYDRKISVEEFKAEQAKERDALETAQAEARFQEKVEVARKAHPDFDEVLEAAKTSKADLVPQFVLNYIVESEKSGELQYYLLKNPDETQRIAKMKPILGIAELGKLEDRLVKPATPAPEAKAAEIKAPERGGAPPPITPISGTGSGSANVDPAKMSYKELREYERNRPKKR